MEGARSGLGQGEAASLQWRAVSWGQALRPQELEGGVCISTDPWGVSRFSPVYHLSFHSHTQSFRPLPGLTPAPGGISVHKKKEGRERCHSPPSHHGHPRRGRRVTPWREGHRDRGRQADRGLGQSGEGEEESGQGPPRGRVLRAPPPAPSPGASRTPPARSGSCAEPSEDREPRSPAAGRSGRTLAAAVRAPRPDPCRCRDAPSEPLASQGVAARRASRAAFGVGAPPGPAGSGGAGSPRTVTSSRSGRPGRAPRSPALRGSPRAEAAALGTSVLYPPDSTPRR